jgi:hypothetical protein
MDPRVLEYANQLIAAPLGDEKTIQQQHSI